MHFLGDAGASTNSGLPVSEANGVHPQSMIGSASSNSGLPISEADWLTTTSTTSTTRVTEDTTDLKPIRPGMRQPDIRCDHCYGRRYAHQMSICEEETCARGVCRDCPNSCIVTCSVRGMRSLVRDIPVNTAQNISKMQKHSLLMASSLCEILSLLPFHETVIQRDLYYFITWM